MKKKPKKLQPTNSLSYKLASLKRDIAETNKELRYLNNYIQSIRNDMRDNINKAQNMCTSSFNLTAGFDGKITRCIERVDKLDQDIARIARKS